MNQVESCNSTFKQTFKHINSIWISLQYSFFFFRLNSRNSTSKMLNENKNSNEIFMCDFVQFICGEWWIMQSHEWFHYICGGFWLWWTCERIFSCDGFYFTMKKKQDRLRIVSYSYSGIMISEFHFLLLLLVRCLVLGTSLNTAYILK